LLHLLWIVPLLLLIFFLSSPRFRGDIAESRVRRLLASGLERNLYTVFNGLVVPSGGGTTPIDHVVVSKFGIFVIESQYVRGWISGGEFQEQWKQGLLGRSIRFTNPMHRNRVHAEALQQLLGYPPNVFHRLVVLAGQKGFKTRLPENVLPPEKLLAQMRKKTRHLLSPEQADNAIRVIDESRLRSPGGLVVRPLALLRLLLLAAMLAGAWFAFRDDVARLNLELQRNAEQRTAPEQFHPDGRRKTELEMREDALVCAYSADTDRCACYDPAGARVELEPGRCRELAERGSVLRQ
jgi:Nuclease-related domain